MVLVWMVSHDVKGLQRVKYGHNCISHKMLGFEAERRREVEETDLSENIVKRFSFKLY